MNVITQKVKWAENELKQNTYIVEFEDCCVVIDAGISVEQVKELTQKPIKAVLITHGHFDHITEIESYAEQNIPVYAHKNIMNMLNNPYENASNLFGENVKFNINNINFVENETININGNQIKCIHTPGHSADGMSYLINKNLFSGDTVFSVAIGRIDLPSSNPEDLVDSLKNILSQDFEEMYAGHGRVSNKQEQQNNIKYWLKILDKPKTLN